MTANDITHADRAEAVLKEEARYQFAKIDALAEALTHAILALVEQQKIANRIALASLAGREDVHESLSDIAYGALDVLLDTVSTGPDDEIVVLAKDTAAALGIEVQS